MFIVSLIVAAAAGAAAVYLLLRPAGGPGNGAVTCPGNNACPVEKGARDFYGLAFHRNLLAIDRITLCDGSSDVVPCRKGYAGFVIANTDAKKWKIEKCEPGELPCNQEYGAIFCTREHGNAPTQACGVLPGN